MDSELLLSGEGWARAVAAAIVVLPALFILFSRRSRWWAKLIWAVVSQLPLLFVSLYAWVWNQRYGATEANLEDALGWWTFAFPWAVYLLYRATRARLSGERPAPPA